jgi:hypothetical protein
MQNLENEKLTWEAPKLVLNLIDNTEVGTTTGAEGVHVAGSEFGTFS